MKLFGRKKKEKNLECNCNEEKIVEKENSNELSGNENSTIKILGSGCKSCNLLEEATKEALKEMGVNVTIDHVTDFSKIATYGVMSTPALVVNEKVVSFGIYNTLAFFP